MSMIKGVANGPPVDDHPDRRFQDEPPPRKGGAPPAGARRTASAARSGAHLRLMVLIDPETGEVSYSWVDRETGEVAGSMSRDDLPKISNDPRYTAGDWVDTLV